LKKSFCGGFSGFAKRSPRGRKRSIEHSIALLHRFASGNYDAVENRENLLLPHAGLTSAVSLTNAQ